MKFEFNLGGGKVQFKLGEEETSPPPAVGGDTKTYCGTCSWHGKFNTLT
jgi:hypothetical protein